MNYISLCGYLSLCFIYCNRKLKLTLAESFMTVFLSYIYIDHVEAFTLDRISILYLLTILYFIENKKISIFLIIFSTIVNEKIIFILGGLFFIRLFFDQKKEYKIYFLITLLSAILAVIIFYIYSIHLDYGYFQSEKEDGLYDTYFSDGLFRISLCLQPKVVYRMLCYL